MTDIHIYVYVCACACVCKTETDIRTSRYFLWWKREIAFMLGEINYKKRKRKPDE